MNRPMPIFVQFEQSDSGYKLTPDTCCSMALHTRVTNETWKELEGLIRKANNIIGHLIGKWEYTLQFQKIDKKTIKIQVYSDASHASNEDKSSQLGYMIFLTNPSKTWNQSTGHLINTNAPPIQLYEVKLWHWLTLLIWHSLSSMMQVI